MSSNDIFDYNEESAADKLARKSKDSPFMIIGILGMIGVCGYGAYNYKNRGKMGTSQYLMQLRVAAQGTVVAALMVGLTYSLIDKYVFKQNKKE